MDEEFGGIWNEAVVAYFKALLQHRSGGTE
jgi:hypothetical protein